MDAIHTQDEHNLSEPFSKIFVDYAEAEWAFDLLRETTRRLRVSDPYDPRVAATLSTRSGRPFLHLNFGNWLVLGFRGPGLTPVRVDMALLAELVTWDERFSALPSAPKEGEPQVRGYELPIEMVRPLTSDLQHAFNTTLDFIADKFADWKRNPHWKQHNPELIEAFFDTEKRAQLFADGMDEPVFFYERHLTAFDSVIAEEREEYDEGDEEVEDEEIRDWEIGDWEMTDKTNDLAEPFSNIFVDREEAKWAFEFLKDTLNRLGVDNPDDPRFSATLNDQQLRLNFGKWAVLTFLGPNHSRRVGIPFLSSQVNFNQEFEDFNFAQSDGEPDVRYYLLPIDLIRPLDDDLHEAHEISLNYISNLFHNWKSTHVRKFNQPKIAEAIFDTAKRNYLFDHGLGKEINDDLDIPDTLEPQVSLNPPYPLSQLAEDTGFDEETLSRWVRAIERKGQAILYGPPGTGKTFITEKLAAHLIGGGDGFVDLVQFHPAYAYEDFIQGLRPTSRREGGLDYRLVPGRFLEFCARAQRRADRCVLIIDEINRANLSRVFGELMYLLEYRAREIPLAGGNTLTIPANARIIGTMNTADRSIALVDHALRRRFAFIALRPNFEALRRYHQNQQPNISIDGLIRVLTRLNQRIDEDYQIGITFFLAPDLANHIEDIWRLEIEPYLEEYFFDQRDEIDDFRWAQIQQEIMPS